MNVGVQGTKKFSDYSVFMRAMGVALSSCKDGEFNIYSAGPVNINSFMSEFFNISETYLKNRGIKVSTFRVPPSFIEENISKFDYFAFLSTPKEYPSKLLETAEAAGVDCGAFRY